MSRLHDLIQQLCPNGVPYKPLGEVAQIQRGIRVVRGQLSVDAPYPVYQNSLTPLGRYGHSNSPRGTTFVIAAGAAGEIGYSDVDFWAADDCYCIDGGETLDNRFVYHVLISRQYELKGKVRKASVPRLARVVIECLRIPVPPMAVQEEIVRILDRFTVLEAELEEQLQTELEARKKQYAYWRERLLTFDDETAKIPCGLRQTDRQICMAA